MRHLQNFASPALDNRTEFKLEALRTLKLRQASLYLDLSLQPIIALCPNLARLDISFTPVVHVSSLLKPVLEKMQKLSLTSTQVPNADLLAVISELPAVNNVVTGSDSCPPGFQCNYGQHKSALTMNNDFLGHLTNILAGFRDLETISLKLGMPSWV